ncbi:MAG: DUF3098 domain-containing protein [Bacteroidales bacterium]|nr:DUF3098 domain-containing protein [Bacteroidales bacterium]
MKKNNTINGPEKEKTKLVFERGNYILFFVGLAVILIGYLLMLGGGSEDPAVFNEKMFNFQRITLSPLLLIAGFVIEVLAIFYRPKKK